MTKRIFTTLWVLCLTCKLGFGQDMVLSGTVKDVQGSPMPGVAVPSKKKAESSGNSKAENSGVSQDSQAEELDPGHDEKAKDLLAMLSGLKKGQKLKLLKLEIKEGETSPPKRYTSGSMILAMENAGQLIEDEELREQIKGSGIGTSATRAEILKKLVFIKYLALNKKTQVITPTQLGK